MTVLEDNIRIIREKITAAARKAGKNPQDILLVAVTKTHPADLVNHALRAGITHFGENKVQEALRKLPLITEPYEGFHFIGHLQTNKIKALLALKPCLIHSVDSLYLAQALNKALQAQERSQDILLQVNTSGEGSKSGAEPSQIVPLAGEIARLPHLQVRGLMTIGRLSDNPEDSRRDFRLLRQLSDEIARLQNPKLDMNWLSMGMTNDFEIAVAEGANLVRIGSAIFGERQYHHPLT